jgi:hypothetical protein
MMTTMNGMFERARRAIIFGRAVDLPAAMLAAVVLAAPLSAHGAEGDSDPQKQEGETVAAAATDAQNSAAPLPSASSDAEVIAYINELIRRGWKDNGVSPSKPATDAEWCRRVYLDVLGRIPTADEVARYTGDRSQDKKVKLIDRLLESDEYIEDYARNWTTIWTNILIGRTGGTDQNTIISREGLQQYLRRSYLQNKPFDQFAYELISANGTSRPGEEGYNGAVNFILDNLDENAAPATAKTARIFLGLQVQCTQCHNHPFNEWKQEQFWSLNAFFRQTRFQRVGDGGRMAASRLDDGDFAGEGTDPKEAEIYYELRNGLLKVAYPVFVDGTRIDPSGYVSEVNRRDQLAELVRKSPYLGKAIVNRMWGHFMGYGFTKPIDDMGPHNAPSHPELLERLGQDFSNHGFDMKQLIRWVTLSEAYSLSSRFVPKKNEKDNPLLGERPLFSHFYLRQMSAEQLYDSLIAATQADNTRGTFEEQERTKTMWLQQFAVAFGTDENDESTTFNGTIPQTLMMMNGELIQKATSGDAGTFLREVADSDMKDNQKIATLYLAALARKPTREEVTFANQMWAVRKGDTLEALKDIFWVLLNSNEFILTH